MQKPYVFISYSTMDQGQADLVNSVLKQNGINTWIATEDIHGGESFATEITNGIKGCDAFVFILSQNSDNSPHCGNELSLAFSARKKIIPFRLHEFDISESNTYFLQQAQWIDCFNNERQSYQELARQIEVYFAHLELKRKAEAEANKKKAQNKQVENFLVRANLSLEQGDFVTANKFCEDMLNIDAEFGKAYLIKLLCDFELTSNEQLSQQAVDFSENSNYKWAIRFCDEEEIAFLESALTSAKERIDQQVLDKEKQEQERLEQIRLERERELNALKEKRELNALVKNTLSAGEQNTVAIKSDGTVLACGLEGKKGRIEGIRSWTDVKGVYASWVFELALKTDGRVIFNGKDIYGIQKGVSEWTDIIDISTGSRHVLGLKSDGTVVSVGKNDFGQCSVIGWSDITSVCAGEVHSLGLKSDGTVVAVGQNYFSQCEVSRWTDIVAIATDVDKSIGLKNDGTVITTDGGWFGRDLAKWTDIIAISVKGGRCLGLRKDGRVVMAGYNENNQCDVSSWTDIIAVSVGDHHSIGLKTDGTVVATGDWKRYDTVYQWKLFDGINGLYKDIETNRIAREQKATLRQKQDFRKKRLCQHCGGKFKGLFKKTCTSCGKKKDYR